MSGGDLLEIVETERDTTGGFEDNFFYQGNEEQAFKTEGYLHKGIDQNQRYHVSTISPPPTDTEEVYS